jgi:hypothetical protein
MLKVTTLTLAAMLAVSGGLSSAQATQHHKKTRHLTPRSAKPTMTQQMPSRQPCPIRGMGDSNWFGTTNDANVYRDRPDCIR